MSEIVSGSNVTEAFTRYATELEKADLLKIGESLLLSPDFEPDLVKELLACSNVGKSLVVISWPSATEVQRISNAFSAKAFYKFQTAVRAKVATKGACGDIEKGCLEIERVIEEFVLKPIQQALKYDSRLTEEMQSLGIVTYAYLQRRCAPLAAFRNSEKRSGLVSDCVENFIERGIFCKVDGNEAFEKYSVRGGVFKILTKVVK